MAYNNPFDTKVDLVPSLVAKLAEAHRDELEQLRPVLEIFFGGLSRQARVSKKVLAAPRKRSAA